MAKPNKGARGSGWSERAAAARQRRFEESEFAKDLAAWQRGELSSEEFERKHS